MNSSGNYYQFLSVFYLLSFQGHGRGILSIIIRELNRGFNGTGRLYQICHDFWTHRIRQTKIDKQSFAV